MVLLSGLPETDRLWYDTSSLLALSVTMGLSLDLDLSVFPRNLSTQRVVVTQ